MTELVLKAKNRRDLGGSNSKKILRKGYLPIVVYGPGRKNFNLKVNYQDFLKIFNIAGENKVVNLKVDDKIIQVLVHQTQKDPVTDNIIHADFYQFKKDHKFEVEIPLKFIGESKAVKESSGVLVKNLDNILIECLYTDLISEIEVDLSLLENINDVIYVSDLKISGNVKVLTSSGQVVASVQAVKVVEEEEKKEEEEEGEKVEVIEGKEKTEDVEKKEGEKSDKEQGEKQEVKES